MSANQVLEEIHSLKNKLKDQIIILGHHYPQDDIIQFADLTGDSLELAKKVSRNKNSKYIIFCGVHFMAETADILTDPHQKIILPDLEAGCSMADMANPSDVQKAWDFLNPFCSSIIPITYINSSASLKSFVGKKNGSIFACV